MNLKKIIFESLMLFSGIFLALLLENYIDDNELREQQEKLLEELILDLDETIADIENDVQNNGVNLEQNKKMISVVNLSLDVQKSEEALEGAQLICKSSSFVVPKTSTFESIKSLGLDLIENNALRTSITAFYELTLSRISTAEKRLADFSSEQCWPYISSNFDWPDPLQNTERQVSLGSDDAVMEWLDDGRLKAKNLDDLLEDSSFKFLLHESLIRRSFQLLHYKRGLLEARSLREQISEYLT